MFVKVSVKLAKGASMPKRATPGSAGFDLKTIESCVLDPGKWMLVKTGVFVAIPAGYEGQLRARSGLAVKHGIGLVNGVGTIDSDYRGEVRVPLINWSQEQVLIDQGDRIAQLVITPVAQAALAQTEDLSETERGEGGFGSTGVSDKPDDMFAENAATRGRAYP